MDGMDAFKIFRAAEALVAARNTGQPIPGLPAEFAPACEDEAFAIQREVAHILGFEIGGWKCAAPPGKPGSGALLPAAGLLRSPARQPIKWGTQIGIEAEIAVRLGADLPGKTDGTAYTRADVLAAIEAVMPAIELVQSRYEEMAKVTPFEAMADSIAHFGFAYGADSPGWRGLDLAQLPVRLSFDGVVQVEKVGGNPSGDPLLSVVWLANRLVAAGQHLRAGEILTTGSCTGLIFTAPDRTVTAAFEGLGEVEVELPASCPFGFT